MATGTLIGRDRELAELEARVRANRVITVVGPGGVGKTTLAQAVADRLGDSFPLGVGHVDLTRIDDERSVRGAVAGQLGFDSFDALLSSPSDRPILLVVDNCEHLLDAVATVVLDVLGACQQPTVLATSRSPLELPGESVMALAPLGVPVIGEDPAACASVRLFLERCRDAGATVGGGALSHVVELCRRLDGLPLAIEIAASRARTMSIAEIADRLADSVDVLGRPRFRGEPRHRSVADTIRWSFELLAPGAAGLLEELAVFAGPFLAAAAREVTGGEDPTRFDDDLDELVNASLVAVDTTGGTTRYRLLDTVRRFALERLRARGALDAVYDRFADHVVEHSRQLLAGSTRSWRPGLLRDLVGIYDNVVEALRWCNTHDDDDPHRSFILCSVLWSIVHQGHADEIATIARETLERWPDRRSSGAARVVATLATAEYVTGNPRLAVDLAEQTLRTLDRPSVPAITLRRVLGQARRALGDTAGALDAFQEGALLGHQLGMAAMAMELEVAAAQVTADAGDIDAAIDALGQVVDRAVELGSTITENWARTTLGWVLLRVGPSQALAVIDAALAQARAVDYPIGIAVNLRSRAFAHLLHGDRAGAVADVSELVADLLARGALSNVRVVVDVTAAIAYSVGHPSWETLVATARSLPISTMASARYELVPVPATTAPPLARHDVIAAVRNVLAELVPEASPASTVPDPKHGGATVTTPVASIAVRGDTCDIDFRNRSVTVRASKGVLDLVRLVEAAGRDVHCLDLAGASVEESSTGDVIDADARRRYEERIRDLQGEVDDAERDNDYARAYRHQVELDALIDHLSAALGRGGRTRRSVDTAERARSAVTHRIRASIRQLDKLHPALGRHLVASISTGIYSSYRPEQAINWRIDRHPLPS